MHTLPSITNSIVIIKHIIIIIIIIIYLIKPQNSKKIKNHEKIYNVNIIKKHKPIKKKK